MTAPLSERKALLAYAGPFAIFMLGIALTQGVEALAGDSKNLLLAKPAFWISPLQTMACAIALAVWWKCYDFGSRRFVPLAIGVGIAVFVMWVSPQWFLGRPVRLDGFDPSVFGGDPLLYWCIVVARFLRLVIVVPLVEEIFWRGFLMRYLISEQFQKVPFGKYSHLSFWAVVVAFTFVHMPEDRLAPVSSRTPSRISRSAFTS
jgi:uncharacterized protein